MEIFNIKLDIFEGPFDLLLYLVRENNIDIYDISISDITDSYIKYIDQIRDKDLNNAGEFLVMASTLVYLKSRMLLPEVPKEVEEEVEKIKSELQSRLIEYKKYKEISAKLRERLVWQSEFVFRKPLVPENELYYEVSVVDLITAFENIIKVKPVPKEIHKEEIKVEDRMLHILEKLEGQEFVSFESLFENAHSTLYKIVTFLAVLELIRISKISVRQKKQFEQILIFKAIEENIKQLESNVDEVTSPSVGND